MVIEGIFVIDIETTGLRVNCSIVEIGICFLNLENGKIGSTFDLICKEQDKILNKNAWIFQNSELRYEDVIDALELNEFKDVIQKIFDLKYPCTAFNQKFDFGFLEQRGFVIQNKFWDPMVILKNIMKIPHHYYGYKFPTVQEAYRYLCEDNNYIEKHTALDDAIHEAKIVYEIFQLIKNKTMG